MHTKLLQCILSFFALLGIVYGDAASTTECRVRAWVRAPDLSPNTIVHGDARVKISAECPPVDSISLGLRFKERSFLKVLRSKDDATQLNPQPPIWSLEMSGASPWPKIANHSRQEAYEDFLTNKDRWIVREEERVVFETMQPFELGGADRDVLRNAVQDFAVLVPSTNFPPGLERAYGGPSAYEILIVEWIYGYFARVSFSNGTTKDISAGFTSFQPLHNPTNAIQGPSSATVELSQQRGMGEKHTENTPVANYSIEISAESGLTFLAATKSHTVNAIVTRTGLAREFSVPLEVSICVQPQLLLKWASEYDMSNRHVNLGLPHAVPPVLRAHSDGHRHMPSRSWPFGCHNRHATHVVMPNSTWDEIYAKEIVTTTSAQVTIPFELDDMYIANFEAYYQTLYNALSIYLKTPHVGFRDADPDYPLGDHEPAWHCRQVEDDEEAWVPYEKPGKSTFWMIHSGSISVVVHPAEEVTRPQHCLATGMSRSDQAVLSDGMHCESPMLTHYLDGGARGPTFVDRSAVPVLLQEDPAARDLRAPVLEPIVFSPPQGEELVVRWRPRDGSPCDAMLVYVGETWAKRVANKASVTTELGSYAPPPGSRSL